MARRRRPSWLTIAGIGLLVVGLAVLGWIGWEFWGTNIVSRREANQATAQLEQLWSNDHAKPVAPEKLPVIEGDAFGIVRIPRFGDTWQRPMFVGTSLPVLRKGIGWFDDTAKPGAVGNFALAAHRRTRNEPFRHIYDLRVGDKVIVETRDHVFTYAIDHPASQLTVQDTETWVLDPVPGKPQQKPTQAIITLTTCAELFSAPTRAVAFGHLVQTTVKQQ